MSQKEEKSLVLPAFGNSRELSMPMERIMVAESRFHEAQMVNPITYVELEHCFNEAYRDLKKHLSSIGFQITQALKALEDAKADVMFGDYAAFLEGKPKSVDTAQRFNAFLIKDTNYLAALDRLNQLKALESHFDGKIKSVENVCRYMRKQMDLILRSGLSGADLYNTNKR